MARPVTRPPLRVHWHKSESGKWLSLKNLDLTHHLVKQQGVYIVFDPSDTLYGILYVGQGKVDERLDERKKDERILELAELDELYVTWAVISGGKGRREGVERFLADTLQPVVGQHPNVPPIPVNVPSLFE
ncbi:MAG: hypothetical protein OXC18_07740 [Desulfurellaceae bacterium]|nr:hypothetical protein [Desulfurellaceae bacterium]